MSEEPSWNSCYPEKYDQLLEEAVVGVKRRFAAFWDVSMPLDVYSSDPVEFRLRCKFLVAGNEEFDDDSSDDESEIEQTPSNQLRHGGWHEQAIYPIDTYPIASSIIQTAMSDVAAYINTNRSLRIRLRGVQYLSTMSGDILITLVYEKRKLGSVWVKNAEQMNKALGYDFIASTKNVNRLIGERQRDFVSETLKGPKGTPLHYRQVAGNFSNPNGKMAEKTLQWLDKCAQEVDGPNTDLLELYCGGGNHTIAMSQCYRRVLGVEINRKLVAVAHRNLAINGATNAFVLRAPSQDFCGSMLRHERWLLNIKKYISNSAPSEGDVEGISEFNKQQFDELSPEEQDEGTAVFDFGAVIVDPPRAGLDEITCKLISRYKIISYISCNPEALLRDLSRLSDTHEVTRMAVFDHFPYSGHLECGAFLVKKSS